MIFTVLSVNVLKIVNKLIPMHFIVNEIQEEKKPGIASSAATYSILSYPCLR